MKNLILITTDQHRADCTGGGKRNVQTPNLDLCSKLGTRFDQCITPSLVCQPARASILTGNLPLTHGVRDNGIDLPEHTGQEGFAGKLSDLGYHTQFIGKAHFSTQTLFEGESGRPECKASSNQYDANWNGPYMGFQNVEMICYGHHLFNMHRPPYGLHYERWFFEQDNPEDKLEAYRHRSPTAERATSPFHSNLSEALHPTTWVADRTINFIKSAPKDQPFCLWASIPDPHYPFDCPEPWASLHHPDDVDLPENRTLDLNRRPRWHREFVERESDNRLEMKNYSYGFFRGTKDDDEILRQMTANYYGMVSLADKHIGRIVNALEANGLMDNTVVAITSDHGEFLGDHGLILKGPCAYDGLIRVGLILIGKDIPSGQIISEPVSTLDIFPTFLDLAGAPATCCDGQSLSPLLGDRCASREYAIMEWDMAFLDREDELRLRTVVTDRYKLTMELKSGAGELYDLYKDPLEMFNLFEERDTQAVVQRLQGILNEYRSGPELIELPRVGLA